jgi:activating signal cointegrator 1
MKVLSLLQPWASLVVMGAKQIETRSWNTKYRGPLLIHASKKYTGAQKSLAVDFNVNHGAGLGFTEDLPVGLIIGSVNLIETFPTEKAWSGTGGIGWKINNKVVVDNDLRMMNITKAEEAYGDYSPGRYGWMLSDPVQFTKGVPVNGKLGIWEYTGVIPELMPKHGPITTQKMARNIWVATCQVTEPLNCEVNQQGISEQDAIDKLKKFLQS